MKATRLAAATCSILVLIPTAVGGAAAPSVRFQVFARTGVKLTDIVWTGRRFLYVDNTTNRIWTVDRTGARRRLFATMPKQTEETRCVPSPGVHGFAPGDLYCHAPDNTLYRIGPRGTVTSFAKLPETGTSDGALAFDTVGRFGFALLAATGRSGNPAPAGGGLYKVSPSGTATLVARYRAQGGADAMLVAPRDFGTGSGQAVLTVDAGKTGTLVMIDARGHAREIATLPDGPNPIVAVPRGAAATRPPVAAGLYVTDTNSTKVFFAPATALSRYAGALLVGTELQATFWIVRPHGGGFRTRRLPATVPGAKFNLEGAVYVPS